MRVIHVDDNPFELERVASALDPTVLGRELTLESFAEPEGYRSRLGGSPAPDLVILDVHLGAGEAQGMTLVSETRAKLPEAVILMCSAMDDVPTMSRCLASGADDFISKRSDKGELNLRILQSYRLARVKRGAESAVPGAAGTSPPAIAGNTLERVATRVPGIIRSAISAVHVVGESGTGKEVVADLFAAHLPPGTPFVKINCGAIAPTLLESELFGHVRGAFTGAVADKKGFIERASGGWIFLDEVACLSASAQVALLRVIENQELLKVGGSAPIKVRVRVVSAANEKLAELVKAGRFRNDLWQRLCEAEIPLPPLRERQHEIEALVHHFCATMPGGPYRVSETALDVLCRAPWKSGNVRELRNCLRAMTELQVEKLLTPLSIPERVWKTLDEESEAESGPVGATATEPMTTEGLADRIVLAIEPGRPLSFETLSDRLLLEVIRKLSRRREKLSLREIARTIGMSRSTLSGRLKAIVQKKLVPLDELASLTGAKAGAGELH